MAIKELLLLMMFMLSLSNVYCFELGAYRTARCLSPSSFPSQFGAFHCALHMNPLFDRLSTIAEHMVTAAM